MANKRADPVEYSKFRVQPVLADGLLAVDRDDGGPQRRVAAAFARIADEAGAIGDRYAAAEGEAQGVLNARAGAPGAAIVEGGVSPDAGGPMAYIQGSSGGAPVAAFGDLAARGKRIRDGLVQRGLSPLMAAAAVGHGRQESSLNPAGPDGDDGSSSGIFQWRGDRRAALQSFAKSAGKDWRSEDAQMDFFVHELKTRERTAWTSLQGARNIEEATAALMHFERPQGYTRRNPTGGHGWDNRLAYARWANGLDGAPAAMAVAGEPAKTGAAAAVTSMASGITPESVAPPSVTPVSVTAGKAGTFRPTGSITIRGRAYDAAGTRTYLESLDATMRADVAAVYDKFKDDPAALDRGFKALRTVQMEDHVFPEIAGDYDSAYGRMIEPYRRQAAAAQEKRVQDRNLGDFLTRTRDLETEKAQAIERFSGEDAAGALASAQSAVDAHYDSAVARGLVDAPYAAKMKIESRREAAVGFYTRQARNMTDAESILAMRDRMREDFGKGELDGADGEAFSLIDRSLSEQAARVARSGETAAKALEKRGEVLADSIVRGLDVDDGAVSSFMLDAQTAPGGTAIVGDAVKRIGMARLLRGASVEEAEGYAEALEKDPASRANGMAAFVRGVADRNAADAKSNPIGYGMRQGYIPEMAPIDPRAAPDALAQSLAARQLAIDELADSDSRLSGIGAFQPNEVAAVVDLWRNGTPDEVSRFTSAMINQLSPKIFRDTLAQPEMQKTVKAAMLSNDPDRYYQAMNTLNALAQGSGLGEVGRTFDEGAIDRLQDYRARVSFSTPEETRDFLKQRSDPAWSERIKPLVAKGRQEARSVAIDDIVKGLSTGWFTASPAPLDAGTKRALQTDFEAVMADRYAATGDVATAKEQALERLKARGWGTSQTLGGRIMFQPPENYYPAIDGGHDWMKADLDAFAAERKLDAANLTLIPDQKTVGAIQSKRLPGYIVSSVDPETGFDQMVTDDQGRPLRWFFDAEGRAKSEKDAKWKRAEDRQSRHDRHVQIREHLRRFGIPGEE